MSGADQPIAAPGPAPDAPEQSASSDGPDKPERAGSDPSRSLVDVPSLQETAQTALMGHLACTASQTLTSCWGAVKHPQPIGICLKLPGATYFCPEGLQLPGMLLSCSARCRPQLEHRPVRVQAARASSPYWTTARLFRPWLSSRRQARASWRAACTALHAHDSHCTAGSHGACGACGQALPDELAPCALHKLSGKDVQVAAHRFDMQASAWRAMACLDQSSRSYVQMLASWWPA